VSAKDTPPSPEITALEAEVVLTREQLASTVDALVDRVDPRRQADRAAERGRRLIFDATDPAAIPEDRARARKVLAVAGVVAALVVVAVVRKVTRG